jgi:pyrroloquinoline quinone biosynthesis protein B
VLFVSCQQEKKKNTTEKLHKNAGVSIVILGTVQDAGSPHIACQKECCKGLFENPDTKRKVVSLGVLDHINKKSFLFEATPDISEQVKLLKNNSSWEANELPDGIFLTHAHIGHYTGLMYLGKEATNAKNIPAYVMPKMKDFLEKNGPWSQLVNGENINLKELENNENITLTKLLKVIPYTVPHRDEYSETVGYKIIGPNKSALFIPDIDKWEKWKTSIVSEIENVDYAFLDATFYDGDEINNRDISQIPHPFVIESMELFKNLSDSEKGKIHFIHFNHTNPLLNSGSTQSKEVLQNGFKIARMNQRVSL